MPEMIRGIVLRETPIGDYDKMMTVLTAEYAARIGADAYAKDAMEGVRIAEAFTA